ncbi:hypothetical protein L0665_09065 [Methanogenium marinum]|uniref:Uncharacterized protein n=1 Tax=Methanogenium marinum TaxID=348610 RepID=A0A9Q4PW65_9EURY|nr:hypothetical protein [Methanogenium marinum]MDE4908755.1 hypothetical protein [Methanogenium marinum]
MANGFAGAKYEAVLLKFSLINTPVGWIPPGNDILNGRDMASSTESKNVWNGWVFYILAVFFRFPG